MTEPSTHFDVHADVRAAHTIDKRFYLDPEVFAQAQERIFARSWQWLGGLHEVAEPGRLLPCEMMGEPLLLARDAAGTLRCMSNVCTHRGNVLVNRACAAADIRCGYHGRRFTLEGRLRGMPGFEGVIGFPSAEDDLPQVPLGVFGGHAFGSFAPRLPFDEVIAEMRQRLDWLPIDTFTPDASRSRDYEFDAHWALYVENYLEGLHIPFVHPGLSEQLDMEGYVYELGRASVLQLAHALPGQAAFEDRSGAEEQPVLPPRPACGERDGVRGAGQHPHPNPLPRSGRGSQQPRIAAYYWWLFPNLMLNFYPWGLSVNLVQPLGIDRTRVLFRSFVRDASLLDQGAGGALDPVEMEDEAVVLGVQRGIRSRLYRHGRYSPRHESGTHHFHRLIAEFMNA